MFVLSCAVAAFVSTVTAQDRHGQPTVEAARTSAPISVDGHLDEEAWRAATPVGGFLQRDPLEGQPATEPTDVRVVYDETAVYVGVRLHDREPDRVRADIDNSEAIHGAQGVRCSGIELELELEQPPSASASSIRGALSQPN